MTSELVHIRTADGQLVTVEAGIVAHSSGLLASLLEHSSGHEIELREVSEPILQRVIEYCRYHRHDPPWEDSLADDAAIAAAGNADGPGELIPTAGPGEIRAAEAAEWDRAFCRVDQGTLFELMKAANFLEVMGLLDLTCRTVAEMLKGKTTEEMRETFGVENDFTAEEEEAVRQEYAWCENED